MTSEGLSVEAGAPAHAFRYDGKVGTLYGIWLLNIVLNIITLGIYSFWGRTRIRRYVIASFALDGDNLEYTGTGKELFKGFLKALPLIIVLYTPILMAQRYPLGGLAFIPLVYFVFVGLYAAVRYRLTRTVWRGIRGHLGGSALKYGALAMGTGLVNIVTLGLIMPWSDRVMIRYMMSNVWFGNTRAEFSDEHAGLWKTHFLTIIGPIVAIILAIIVIVATAGENRSETGSGWSFLLVALVLVILLSRFWYAAALRRYQFNNLKIGPMRFAADFTGGAMARLFITNGLILIFTLGFGVPIIINRSAAFLARYISLRGDLQTAAAAFQQSPEDPQKSGEGLDSLIGGDSSFF